MLPFVYPTLFVSTVITLRQVPGCPFVEAHGCVLAMEAFYCLGAGWSQWRPLDIPGTHLPLSLMQLLMIDKTKIKCVDKGEATTIRLLCWQFECLPLLWQSLPRYSYILMLYPYSQSIKLFLFTIKVPQSHRYATSFPKNCCSKCGVWLICMTIRKRCCKFQWIYIFMEKVINKYYIN